MQDGNQIPEELDFTRIADESTPTSDSPQVDDPDPEAEKQYGTLAIILSVAIILVIMAALWIFLQPGTPKVDPNLPLPGSTPATRVQSSQKQIK